MLTHLPHRIVVKTESRTTFSGGGYTTSWTTLSSEWVNCQMIPASKESYEQMKKQQFTMWRIIMRTNTAITNKNRIEYGTKILTIETVIDQVNRGRMMELKCREEVI